MSTGFKALGVVFKCLTRTIFCLAVAALGDSRQQLKKNKKGAVQSERCFFLRYFPWEGVTLGLTGFDPDSGFNCAFLPRAPWYIYTPRRFRAREREAAKAAKAALTSLVP